MFEPSIREASRSDLPELIVLFREHAEFENAEYQPTDNAERLESLSFSDHPTIQLMVVESSNQLVGYAAFMVQYSTWQADSYLYLDCLYLRPAWRGRGLGKQLMDQVRSHANKMGCRQIQWQTPSENQAAIEFYDRLPQTNRYAKLRYIQVPEYSAKKQRNPTTARKDPK